MAAQHGRGLTRRERSTRIASGRWLAVAAVTLLAMFRFIQAPAVLAASVDAPHLSVVPAVVAPGQPLTVILRMGSIPANFVFPQCAVVDITSNVLAAKSGGVLAVTVTGPGSFYAEATVPSGTAPGSYGIEARACGITWATAAFEVTDGHAGHRRRIEHRCAGRWCPAPFGRHGLCVRCLGLLGLAAALAGSLATLDLGAISDRGALALSLTVI